MKVIYKSDFEPGFYKSVIFHIRSKAEVLERGRFVMWILCLVDWTSDRNMIRMRTFYISVGLVLIRPDTKI